ncbi:MAG TPA: hypothetical protein VLA75_09940, partial [Thermoanaerobaculia bacterium]|nr:hypothetical protein [Thermoanaerobaculia bacterium]
MSRPPTLLLTALAVALLAAPGARAQAGGGETPLPLSAAVASALAAHPSLAAAQARQEAAQATLGEAEAAGRPVARLLATGMRYGEPVPVTPIHGFSPADLPPFDETLVQGTLSLRTTLYDS